MDGGSRCWFGIESYRRVGAALPGFVAQPLEFLGPRYRSHRHGAGEGPSRSKGDADGRSRYDANLASGCEPLCLLRLRQVLPEQLAHRDRLSLATALRGATFLRELGRDVPQA